MGSVMAVSANHLDELVGKKFTDLQYSGLSTENATTSGSSYSNVTLSTYSNVTLSTVESKTTGSSGPGAILADTETIISVNDAQNSIVVNYSVPGYSSSEVAYVLGFAPDAILVGGNTSNVYASSLNGTFGPTADYTTLNIGTGSLSSAPLAASTDITFSTAGTYTGSAPPAAPPPPVASAMAVSANHLDGLVGETFTGLQYSGLSTENATTIGSSFSNSVLSTVESKTTGSSGPGVILAATETIVSVNDAQDSIVLSTSVPGYSSAETVYILGFASNVVLLGGNTSNVYAGSIYGTSGPTADYSTLNGGTGALSSTPLAAGTDITFSTTGTYTGSVSPTSSAPPTGSTPPATPPPPAPVTASSSSYTITANSTTYTTPGASSTVTDSTSGYNLIASQGSDTITAGAGYDTIFASGPSVSVTGGSGHLIFVAGNGNYSAGGGSGVDTLYGGGGADIFTGGAAGGSVLVAGTGNTTLSGGNADVMFGGPGATTFNGSAKGGDIMVGGTGQNTFNMTNGDAAFGASGTDTFNAGAGSAIIVEGSGQETANFGAGTAYVFEGTGADSITVVAGMRGTDGIVGFKASDHITFEGYTSAQLQTALSTASIGSFGTSITFSDGTKLVAYGYNVQTLSPSQVSIG